MTAKPAHVMHSISMLVVGILQCDFFTKISKKICLEISYDFFWSAIAKVSFQMSFISGRNLWKNIALTLRFPQFAFKFVYQDDAQSFARKILH